MEPDPTASAHAVAVVGPGRAGTTLASALAAAGHRVVGPLGREDALGDLDVDLVLLCVPDAVISSVARSLPRRDGRLVGHVSGATPLTALGDHEALSLHPLTTIPREGADLTGVTAAVAGSTPRALEVATRLAGDVGMSPVSVAEEDRAAYHAAACVASNFLVTLEGAAEALAATAGLSRERLVPLVRATVESWAERGPERALTGPIARGDEQTVAGHRAAVAERLPEHLGLFDALAAATRTLAGRPAPDPTPATDAPSRPPMRTVTTVAELRAGLAAARRAGRSIGLVPTMGALHEGHLTLVRTAAEQCEEVVVSLFVNPTQFDDAGDLAAYPRDEARDAELAAAAGASWLFAPSADVVYPPGFATRVSVSGVSEPLEGEHRGALHFDGVALVVTKLFSMVGADVAFFGQKDAQQVAVVRRVATDLDLPTRIETVPTVREPDGLAMSSRNVRLAPEDRVRALALRHGLDAVRDALLDGAGTERAVATGRSVMRDVGVEPEYLAVVDPSTFTPRDALSDHPVLVAVAARVGPVRLIDNELVGPVTGTAGRPTGVDPDADVADLVSDHTGPTGATPAPRTTGE
ncbi:pantoate--beta-alanine ligase [Auraticoccus monumenti]|uniref:Pantothenate synthetase n=1 Tax=Auraticoccus monumenti TaxID=675864 RepID=A0A1G6VGI7_9ACTN|nr:pantoate--beta-alanine ligase [Auraticoccus monumenti]SDD52601.1 pantoate--beta-alanine ligase [Auraticoccus monumenti]